MSHDYNSSCHQLTRYTTFGAGYGQFHERVV